MTTSPFKLARENCGLSRQAMALALGVSYPSVAAADLGHLKRIPPHWFPALEAVGLDPAGVAEAYDLWRRSFIKVGA